MHEATWFPFINKDEVHENIGNIVTQCLAWTNDVHSKFIQIDLMNCIPIKNCLFLFDLIQYYQNTIVDFSGREIRFLEGDIRTNQFNNFRLSVAAGIDHSKFEFEICASFDINVWIFVAFSLFRIFLIEYWSIFRVFFVDAVIKVKIEWTHGHKGSNFISFEYVSCCCCSFLECDAKGWANHLFHSAWIRFDFVGFFGLD